MTMSLYIARRFLTTVGMVFLIFFGILLLIDMIEQMRKLSGSRAGLADAFRLSVLNVPDTLYRILPLILIIGSVALFLALARSSELVVVRAAGRSGLQSVVARHVREAAEVDDIGELGAASLDALVATGIGGERGA